LLGPEVLLHGHRVVAAALDRGVISDDDDGRALDRANAGDDPCGRRVVVVEAVCRERTQLEEWASGVQQPVDPLADGKLAALSMAGDRSVVAARSTPGDGRLAAAQIAARGRH